MRHGEASNTIRKVLTRNSKKENPDMKTITRSKGLAIAISFGVSLLCVTVYSAVTADVLFRRYYSRFASLQRAGHRLDAGPNASSPARSCPGTIIPGLLSTW